LLKPYLFTFLSLIVITAVVFTFQSCSGSGQYTAASLPGTFEYHLVDQSGERLLEGKVSFKETSDGKYTMEFVIDKTLKDFPGVDGFRSQNPTVTYTPETRKVFIAMTPMTGDYQLYLNLDLVGNSLAGDWSHDTMKGTQSQGRFYGTRIN
jgi:hypothetical protein